jgi:PWWP domain/Bromodomain
LGTSTRPASSVLRRNSNSGSSSRHGSVDDEELGQEDGRPQEVQETAPTKGGEADVLSIMDPERALEVAGLSISERKEMCLPVTVHWDPVSPDGNKIGWKLKIKIKHEYHVGRVVRYDPCTHKHKVQLVPGGKSFWIWLRNEQHELQVATRIVWALVKGYAWWPALVMEANSADSTDVPRKEGFVTTEFFGTGEVSSVRNSDESIRPFDPNVLDIIVQKHRKKRNQKAFDLACEEFRAIQHVRNQAALFYARSAFAMSSYYAPKNVSGNLFAGRTQMMVGRKVRLFRGDVNYPYGDTVVGFVRQYSHNIKKWLVSFNAPENKTKYPAAWMNLFVREHACTVLDKKTKIEARIDDIIPFVRGFSAVEGNVEDNEIADLLHDRCLGCTENLDDTEAWTPLVTCVTCNAQYHLGCVDPPMSQDQYQRMLKGSQSYVCPRCTVCKGCHQKDITFGSHPHPSPPAMLSMPNDDALNLCFSCQQLYDTEHFCPNCAHIWDDKRFYLVEKQISEGGALFKGRNRRQKDGAEDDLSLSLAFGSFRSDEVYASGFKVEPRCYYPETQIWGFTENEMLLCDSCNVWVHAGCSGLNEKEYNATSAGNHPIFSTEFLCFVCCRKRCKKLIKALEDEDRTVLFAVPVSEKVAPNYYDLIKEPMSLRQMQDRLDSLSDVFSYAWIREDFELMVLNALTFNRYVSTLLCCCNLSSTFLCLCSLAVY